MKNCPKCQAENTDEANYCCKCGESLNTEPHDIYCRFCGQKISSDDIFCPNCGKRLIIEKTEPKKLDVVSTTMLIISCVFALIHFVLALISNPELIFYTFGCSVLAILSFLATLIVSIIRKKKDVVTAPGIVFSFVGLGWSLFFFLATLAQFINYVFQY